MVDVANKISDDSTSNEAVRATAGSTLKQQTKAAALDILNHCVLGVAKDIGNEAEVDDRSVRRRF